jgi:hypothetical protein
MGMTDRYEHGDSRDEHFREGRRRVLVRGIEIASAVPLAILGIGSALKKRAFFEADIASATLNYVPDSVTEFAGMHEGLQGALGRLASSYKSEYHRSHQEMYTTVDSEGHTKIRYRTVWRWEEPKNVPDHSSVFSWRDAQGDVVERASFLVSSPLVDVDKAGHISIEEREKGRLGQSFASGGIYLAEVGALLGYEEIVAKMNYKGSERISTVEKVRRMNTQKQINRRSWLKVGAALLGAGAAFKFSEDREERAMKGRDELEGVITDTCTIGDGALSESGEIFRTYFGISHTNLVDHARDVVETSERTLGGGVKSKKVRSAFERVTEEGKIYLSNLEKTFEKGVSKELAHVSKCGIATKAIAEENDSQESNATASIFIEGGIVGGIMAATIVGGEIFNEKYP